MKAGGFEVLEKLREEPSAILIAPRSDDFGLESPLIDGPIGDIKFG